MIRQFIILLVFPSCIMTVDYCSICSHHTMCKYKGPGPACGHDKTSGVSKNEIVKILKIHNDFRSFVALGKEQRGSPGPQPTAANMNALIWDNNLAEVAQRWADQCTFQHDFCRQDPRFHVGQNIFFASGYPTVNWTQAISTWYQEVTQFDSQTVDEFQFQPTTGHYTQLVWGTTRYIGCGRTSYGIHNYRPFNVTNNGRYHFEEELSHTRVKKWINDEWRSTIYKNHILVCNYGPSGNFLFQRIYTRGKPCSHCPSGFRCINGLCI